MDISATLSSPSIGSTPDSPGTDEALQEILDCKDLPLSKWITYNLDVDSTSGHYSDHEYTDQSELRSRRKAGKDAR